MINVLMLCVLCMQGCSLIDDDLTVCGKDFELELQMELQTSLDLELETVLSAETDIYARTVLREYFSNIFTDHAHDINIGFFSTQNDELVYSIHDVIDANQSTYTFYLPKDDYYAIALANLDSNVVVSLADEANSRMARLLTLGQDTLPTQETGIFVVEREIAINDTADQKIDLTLHMASSAFAVIIDTTGVPITGVRAFLLGTADELMLRDSLYLYTHPCVVRMEEIAASATNAPSRVSLEEDSTATPLMYGCVSFPSSDKADADDVYYKAKVYVGMPDGSTTETVFSMHVPLLAGELKVVKATLSPGGGVQPSTPGEVGASVTLDWKNGNEFNQEL